MTSTIDNKHPRVGVAVLLFQAGKLLLIRRKGSHGAGSWATPGGHLEFGEEPADCARREAKEEVGVDVGEVTFRSITNDLFVEEGKHYITLWMSARITDGEPTVAARDEVAELGWFDPSDLPQPLFLPLRNLLSGHALPTAGETGHHGV